jgi:hypothetical protein
LIDREEPPPISPGAAPHWAEPIYAALCGARLWTDHHHIPELPEENELVSDPDPTVPTVFGEGRPPESECSPFAADEDPEPLALMGEEI